MQAALETSRWAVTGWKVMSELPNPVNFEAATSYVDERAIRDLFAVGPQVETLVRAVRSYAEAGFDRLVLMNAGARPGRFPGLLRTGTGRSAPRTDPARGLRLSRAPRPVGTGCLGS